MLIVVIKNIKRRIILKNKKIVTILLFFTLIFTSFSAFLSTDQASAATPSFLMDTKKIYTHSIQYDNSKKKHVLMTVSFTGEMNKGHLWNYQGKDFFSNQLIIQNNESLTISDPFNNESSKELVFPLTVGKTWDNGDGDKFKILSLNTSVKTEAGTFNTVAVDNGADNGISYYAPGVGLVKYRDNTGFTQELTKISNAHYGRVLIKQTGIKQYTPKGAVHKTLKKGEALKVFKENADSYDVGNGYYVKKEKNTLFFTGTIYGTEAPLSVYSPNGKLFKKFAIDEPVRAYGFKDGKFQVGGGYYVPAADHILYER